MGPMGLMSLMGLMGDRQNLVIFALRAK